MPFHFHDFISYYSGKTREIESRKRVNPKRSTLPVVPILGIWILRTSVILRTYYGPKFCCFFRSAKSTMPILHPQCGFCGPRIKQLLLDKFADLRSLSTKLKIIALLGESRQYRQTIGNIIGDFADPSYFVWILRTCWQSYSRSQNYSFTLGP